jgi:predicted AlkP superfamily pyrophosphatase or phosphodiesterase
MKTGAWGDLESLVPSASPAIWTTIATGYLPARHGIEGFTVTVPESGATTLPGTAQRRESAVWNLASDEGFEVGVVNWWASFPAEAVNGFVVSDRANLHRRFGYRSVLGLSDRGLETIGSGETSPPWLLTRILDSLGGNDRLPSEAARLLLDPMPTKVREELENQPRLVRDNRLSVLKFLMLQDHAARAATHIALQEVSTPDLLMVYFSGIDAVEHQFWAYYEPQRFAEPPPESEIEAFGHVIPAYYEYIDGLLADLLEGLPSETLIVLVSDHGHDPNRQYRPSAPGSDYGRWTSGTHGHGPPGILLLSGPGVRHQQLQSAHVLDIAPTLLAALGVQPTSDMSGRVLEEAFTPEWRKSFPTDRIERRHVANPGGQPTPAEVDPEILEKLRALGYIK